VEAKFGPLKEDKNNCYQSRRNFSEEQPKKECRNFGRFERRTSCRETKKIQIKLATTCNKNKQQENAKNNAEL
jgi:hypothetical protein